MKDTKLFDAVIGQPSKDDHSKAVKEAWDSIMACENKPDRRHVIAAAITNNEYLLCDLLPSEEKRLAFIAAVDEAEANLQKGKQSSKLDLLLVERALR